MKPAARYYQLSFQIHHKEFAGIINNYYYPYRYIYINIYL